MYSVSELKSVRFKRFPPSGRGVFIPTDSRRTAALGICLYTVSRRPALVAQQLAYRLVALLGARILPGRSEQWEAPEPWDELVAQWESCFGRIDSLAIHQRKHLDRVGITLLAARGGQPLAVIKVRDREAGLLSEQRALAALVEMGPRTFRSPTPLGTGAANGWYWSAQEAVFARPHVPVFTAPAELFDEVHAALESISPRGETTTNWQLCHRDLTPWNLRRDSKGVLWLFDWEDCGLAPSDSDRAYFAAAARAVRGVPMPRDLDPKAIAYCQAEINARLNSRAGVKLPLRLLAALDEAVVD